MFDPRISLSACSTIISNNNKNIKRKECIYSAVSRKFPMSFSFVLNSFFCSSAALQKMSLVTAIKLWYCIRHSQFEGNLPPKTICVCIAFHTTNTINRRWRPHRHHHLEHHNTPISNGIGVQLSRFFRSFISLKLMTIIRQ